MSDERLGELGVPRRRFLRRAAAVAFAAPVVVSFGLDGVAEAVPSLQFCANQSFGNQSHFIAEVIAFVGLAVSESELSYPIGRQVGQQLAQAMMNFAVGRSSDGCRELETVRELVAQTSKVQQLVTAIEELQAQMGCTCRTG